MTAVTKHIKRIVLIANPKSTGDGVAVANDLKAQIKEAFPSLPIRIAPTKRPGHAKQLARAAAKQTGTLIVSVSGDGGYNEVVNGAVAGARQPLCVVHGAGNANDHHEAVQRGAGLIQLLKEGKVVAMPLLEVTLPGPRGSQKRLAHSYVGFGITARVAQRLNREATSPMSEIGLVLRSLHNHRPLEADLGDGMRKYDVLIAFNVPRMGKYLKVAKLKPQTNRFGLVKLRRGPWWQWPWRLVVALTRGVRPDVATSSQEFAFDSPTQLQLDGEVIACAKRAQVRVRVKPDAIRTILPA
jgi:diacylglycerol kinase (ATP)